jgi:hypothetical protein
MAFELTAIIRSYALGHPKCTYERHHLILQRFCRHAIYQHCMREFGCAVQQDERMLNLQLCVVQEHHV